MTNTEYWKRSYHDPKVVLYNNYIINKLFGKEKHHVFFYDGDIHYSYLLSSICEKFDLRYWDDSYYLILFFYPENKNESISEKDDIYLRIDKDILLSIDKKNCSFYGNVVVLYLHFPLNIVSNKDFKNINDKKEEESYENKKSCNKEKRR